MSQQDNFSGGFLLGVIVGSVVGGVVGSLLTARQLANGEITEETLEAAKSSEDPAARGRKRPLRPTDERTIEAARRTLEDKIAQLNDAIDDVRQQLGNENANGFEEVADERSLAKDA